MFHWTNTSMNSQTKVVNVVMAGLGGQGIVKASDILAGAAHIAGYDVKKSEIHGMSQRGGSVSSDVRFGSEVFSPMVPAGEADFLLVCDPTQIDPNRHMLREGGELITPDTIPFLAELDNSEEAQRLRRSVNVALLGALSAHVDIAENAWIEAIHENLPAAVHDLNEEVFRRAQSAERDQIALTAKR